MKDPTKMTTKELIELADEIKKGMTDEWLKRREKIKSNPLSSSIPVIMCTAKDNVGDVEKSFHYGAQAFVIKPVIFKKLIKKVEAILDLEEMLND